MAGGGGALAGPEIINPSSLCVQPRRRVPEGFDTGPESRNTGIDLHQFAQQRGYEIVHEDVDHGVSGTKVRRPALDQLFKDAHRQKFDAVLVWPQIGGGVVTKHFLQILDDLSELGIQFLSQREAIDTGGPLGRAIVIISSAS
jgi:DNA invertase Pin-like site-specific DNA recombinase